MRLEVEGPGASKADVQAIRQPFVVVGRDEGVDLQLDHPAVGRRHAYLQVIEGRLFCMDMQSRTGTVWPNGPKTMGWVRPNRPISIGPYRIWFQGGEGPSRGVPDGAGRGVEAAGADHEDVLEIDGPGRGVTIWRMRRPIVVLGRGRPSWVLLPHEDVSRIHCSIIRTENELWVVDLLGRDGITVNHRQVRFSRVTADDMIGIGPYRIRMLAPAVPGRVITVPGRVVAGPLGVPRHPAPHSTILPMGPPPLLPAAQVEPNVAGLAPLFQEISQMQQQMADQFQQALMMMFQLFSTMHQDQMGLIREELTQIRKLAMEQQAIQAELVRQQQQQERAAAPWNAESGGGAGIVLTDRAVFPPTPALRGVEPRPGPVPRPGPSGAGGWPAGFEAGLGAGAPPGADGGSGAGVEAGPRPASSSAGESASSASPRQGPAYPDQDGLHLMLSQRLAAIQEERQSRWQKLLDTVMGKSAPPAAP